MASLCEITKIKQLCPPVCLDPIRVICVWKSWQGKDIANLVLAREISSFALSGYKNFIKTVLAAGYMITESRFRSEAVLISEKERRLRSSFGNTSKDDFIMRAKVAAAGNAVSQDRCPRQMSRKN